MDVQRNNSGQVTTVGLTCLQIPSDDHAAPDRTHSSQNLKELAKKYAFDTRDILVAETGQKRYPRHPQHIHWEAFAYGKTEVVPLEDLTETVVLALESFKNEARPNLVLVGYFMSPVMREISGRLSKVTEYFSSWVDLQEIVCEVVGDKSISPGTADILPGLGFGDDHAVPGILPVSHAPLVPKVIPKVPNAPENVNAPEDADAPEVISNPKRFKAPRNPERFMAPKVTTVGHTTLWRCFKPGPREKYPFIAQVRLSDGPLRSYPGGHYNASRWLKVFYGMITLDSVSALATSHENGVGWICFPTLQGLDTFIQQANGMKDPQGGIWTVTEDEDCQRWSSGPESIAQLREKDIQGKKQHKRTKAQLEAAAAEKKKFDWKDQIDAFEGLFIGVEEKNDDDDKDRMELDDEGEDRMQADAIEMTRSKRGDRKSDSTDSTGSTEASTSNEGDTQGWSAGRRYSTHTGVPISEKDFAELVEGSPTKRPRALHPHLTTPHQASEEALEFMSLEKVKEVCMKKIKEDVKEEKARR
ncbi:hypothetical protein QBC34DRAFT_442260 [Podospora aff. communis PSN243]|uniref:Uncharacterized protein n=1 Tax=Podospora aff. communis PSN243 TaxID=3040156 RepID=A0AAV9G9E2_9PEZI|nr:hypothetical protein QBC34DRAFT_442260 [Podospora aff. communis PSN243]